MPGENSLIWRCSSSERTKGVAIFRVPTRKDKCSNNWMENIINVITRDRVVDKILRDRIDKVNIYVFEKHFQRNSF